jgi:hypothetical protein
MASEQVSVRLDPWIVAEAREIVGGDVDLSMFVNDVLHWQLQNVRREWDAMKASWKEERQWRVRAERRAPGAPR